MPIKGLKGGIGTKALGYGLGAAEEEIDAEFNNTVLLLHSDGSEGAGDTALLGSPNYKAFKDNSTSAHALKVDADAYGNDFSPYYYADGYWSVAFDGNDLMTQIGTNDADLKFGTSDFTIEFFIFKSQNPTATAPIIDMRDSTAFGSQNTMALNLNTSGQLLVYVANSERISPSSSTALTNGWNHVAYTRDYSTPLGTLYLNGTSVGTWADNINYNETDTEINIGGAALSGLGKIFGYISNVRICKSLVYSSNFTPTTAPLTTTSQSASSCVFLGCQSNRFVDNSTNNFTISLTDAPKVSTNSPFTVTKTANVGSGFFDGTDDHVETLNTSSDFNLGTDQFTIEAWVYTQSTNQQTIVIPTGSTPFNIYLHYDAVHVYSGSVIIDGDSGSVESYVQKHAWNHVVVQRDSSNYLTLYVNGVRKYYTVNASDFSANNKIRIGEHSNDSNGFEGYIADVRFVKGSAVYSGTTITVPTSSLTAVTNTKLLTCQYSGAVRNVGFDDESKFNHQITRNGDVSMGTFSPFSLEDGYWSVYFDGSDDELNLTNTATIGTGNFTMEMWVYPHNRSNSCLIDSRSANGATDGIIFKLNSNKFQISGNDGTTNIPLEEWTHLAVVREGTGTNETKMYVNGALEKTITFNLNLSSTFFGVGVFNDGSNSGPYKGYISNLRVVNDTVYTDAFTVPSTPLTAISNTDVLICQSNRFVDNSTNGFAITVPQGTPKVFPFSPLAPTRSYSKDVIGGSAHFDGTGDDLKIEPQNDQDVFNPTTTYTLEGWVYVDVATPGTRYFLSKGGTSTGWSATNGHYLIMFYYSNSVYIQVKTGSGSFFGLSGAHGASFQWNHFAVGFDGTTTRFWWNGETINSTTTAPEADTDTDGDQLYLGVSNDGSSGQWAGYISNVRYVRGTDIYGVSNASITVPTSPPTAVTNTNFLTTFTNAGIIDHTMKNDLRTVGNTRITTTDKKLGTGSLVFDGDDYLEAVNTEDRELFTPGTGDMTWEMFVKFDTLDGLHTLFGKYGSGSEYFFYYDNANTDWRLVYHTSTYTWDDNSITTDTWYHIALVKDGTTHYLFKDGTSLGTNVATYNTSQTGRNFVLGTAFNGSNAALYQLKGKLDEVRVTRVARYTSNFTAPTKAFGNR